MPPEWDVIAGWARGTRTLGSATRPEKLAVQRWHQGDLFQKLVDQGVWEVLSLPMEFEQETRCKERAKPTATELLSNVVYGRSHPQNFKSCLGDLKSNEDQRKHS